MLNVGFLLLTFHVLLLVKTASKRGTKVRRSRCEKNVELKLPNVKCQHKSERVSFPRIDLDTNNVGRMGGAHAVPTQVREGCDAR